MKICIIGAGPAGSFAAYNLADNHDVEIFEKKSQIGLPIQCSGLVTNSIKKIDKIFQTKEFRKTIQNKINKVNLLSKNEKCGIILKEKDYVLDREKFDKWLSNLAKKRGAKIHLNTEFIKFKREKKDLFLFIKGKDGIKKIKTDILIGADGTFSKVSEQLKNKPDFIQCIQGDIRLNSEKSKMSIFFSEKYKGLFAWIIPKNSKIVEVGLGCKYNAGKKFREFLKYQRIKGKITKYTGGSISLYNPKQKISDKNIFLIGEAASFVKASTFGGIIPGLKSAKILAYCIKRNKSYENELRKFKKEMFIHSISRKVLNKFDDSDYNCLLKLCQNKNLKRILSKYSRDEFSEKMFALKTILAEPKLIKFLFKLR